MRAPLSLLDHKLLQAVTRENLDEVRKSLRKGANVNVVCHITSLTPLHISTFKGFIEITKLLLSAKADVTKLNKAGDTPLLSVLTSDEFEEDKVAQQYQAKVQISRDLLSAKAQVNVADINKITPLHRLVKFMFQNSHTLVRHAIINQQYHSLLLDFLIAGGKIHTKDCYNQSPVEICLKVMSNISKISKVDPLLPGIYRATSSMLAFSTSKQLEKLFTAVKTFKTPNPWLLKQAKSSMSETQTKAYVVQGSKKLGIDLRYLDQVAKNYSRLFEAFKANKNSWSHFKQIPKDLLLYIAALEIKDIAFPLPSSLTLSLLSSSSGIDASYPTANVLQEAVEKEGTFADKYIQKIISDEVQR